ncbi:General stress protein 13 [Novipirellula aureliae]|uniref:General stress protein 13 n=1 Tax=Novipirellula aureliae TaxID=2527966 RepID=A0A5C6E3E3_9BACT|nr:Tex-like N-terminal domain-containing protein [Novipirellula aureliae]TWU43205.1 General stress protein 13 [Novipirellula aureliae]
MTVDLEAIAQRGRCEESNLRLALPLIEQGYEPPFLARYRRDELGGLDEPVLWALAESLKNEKSLAARRAELIADWQATPLADPALGRAIEKAGSKRMLQRLTRRIKLESNEAVDGGTLLALRVLNPQKDDTDDFQKLAESVEGIENHEEAIDKLEESLARRLAGDPRMINAAVQWLSKHARIHVAEISDPHISGNADASGGASEKDSDDSSTDSASRYPTAKAMSGNAEPAAQATAESPTSETPTEESPAADASIAAAPAVAVPASDGAAAIETVHGQELPTKSDVSPETAGTQNAAETPATETPATETPATETPATETPAAETPAAETPAAETPAAETPAAETPATETPAAETPATETPAAAANAGGETAIGFDVDNPSIETPKKKKKKGKEKVKEAAPKKPKKVSPRQRRRRWLMSVLKPLEGKQINANKLSSFQTVMLARALRSQVAQCSFEYDANKLVAELQRTAGRINSKLGDTLEHIVVENEADIRSAAEAAWWDELQERASGRLLGIAADHLRSQVNRGGIEAKVILAIDAVGPRTAAASIVAADGRLLHYEDLPCQLSAPSRSQAVLRMGELIHSHHVDLIVISNGPSRRGCLLAVGELIKQSPENSIHWTLADRSGADTYAGSAIADQEMRSTPRRFRAASWIAFSVVQPAQAIAKVDPLKLRLGSFQRELSDQALLEVLDDVIVSGASRGGVDVNSAPTSWLSRLPGVSETVAASIDATRRESLFHSRQQLSELEQWDDASAVRQAMPFLRVFGSDEPLDSTLIHPDDYPLAKKLASALGLEMPPATPPGYQPPDFSEEGASPANKPVDLSSEPKVEPRVVEDFSSTDPSSDADGAKPFGEVSETNAEETSDTQATSDAEATSVESPIEPTASQPTAEAETSTEPDASAEQSDASKPAEWVEPSAEQSDTAKPSAVPAATNGPVDNTFRQVKPEKAKVDKCVKEWQIGYRKAYQIVRWLCDPFGEGDANEADSHGVLTSVPSLKSLKPGDQVIGVAVGVMPFGVFVELAPDCSGLIHVSKVSDRFVEDLHEAIQVGDVVTTWVTGIDEKRRRVALSAISPEREAELAEQRAQQGPRGRSGGPPRGKSQARGGRPANAGGRSDGGGGRGPNASHEGRGGGGKAGPSRGGSDRSGSGRSGSGRSGSGRGRDHRGGGRDNRSGRGQRQPESYRVTSSKAVEPISDAMKQGEEPLRSFGDLMQFFKKPEPAKPEPAAEKPKQESGPNPAEGASEPLPENTKPPENTTAAASAPPPSEVQSGDNQPSDSVKESASETTETPAPSTDTPA